jgi:hypothetical protein
MDNSVYFLPKGDSIFSILHQLHVVSSVFLKAKRPLIVTTFSSPYYHAFDEINLCDYFIFPTTIICTYENKRWITLTKSCIFYGNEDDFNKRDDLKDFNLTIKKQFDFNTVQCIAGHFSDLISNTTGEEFTNGYNIFDHITFQHKYYEYFRIAKDLFHFDQLQNNFMVIHWRRNQMTKENSLRDCPYGTNSHHCLNIFSFVKLIEALKRNHNSVAVYVATNEKNPHLLNALAQNSKLLIYVCDSLYISCMHMIVCI